MLVEHFDFIPNLTTSRHLFIQSSSKRTKLPDVFTKDGTIDL